MTNQPVFRTRAMRLYRNVVSAHSASGSTIKQQHKDQTSLRQLAHGPGFWRVWMTYFVIAMGFFAVIYFAIDLWRLPETMRKKRQKREIKANVAQAIQNLTTSEITLTLSEIDPKFDLIPLATRLARVPEITCRQTNDDLSAEALELFSILAQLHETSPLSALKAATVGAVQLSPRNPLSRHMIRLTCQLLRDNRIAFSDRLAVALIALRIDRIAELSREIADTLLLAFLAESSSPDFWRSLNSNVIETIMQIEERSRNPDLLWMLSRVASRYSLKLHTASLLHWLLISDRPEGAVIKARRRFATNQLHYFGRKEDHKESVDLHLQLMKYGETEAKAWNDILGFSYELLLKEPDQWRKFRLLTSLLANAPSCLSVFQKSLGTFEESSSKHRTVNERNPAELFRQAGVLTSAIESVASSATWFCRNRAVPPRPEHPLVPIAAREYLACVKILISASHPLALRALYVALDPLCMTYLPQSLALYRSNLKRLAPLAMKEAEFQAVGFALRLRGKCLSDEQKPTYEQLYSEILHVLTEIDPDSWERVEASIEMHTNPSFIL